MHEHGEYDDLWYSLMSGQSPKLRAGREFYRWMPARDRCKLCSVPFDGIAGPFVRLLARKRRARKSPNICDL